MKTKLMPALFVGLLPCILSAQVKQSLDVAAVSLPTAVNSAVPSVSLGLKANEALRTFNVPLQNDETKSTQVYGVQTSAGLFLVDYPKTIPAKGQATLTLLYVAGANSSADTDFVRLLTDHGEKIVEIKHTREQAASLDISSLQWQQDDPATTKTVTLTMVANSSAPKGVKVLGGGAIATMTSLGANRYAITVTPVSTAKPQQFPVSIQFAPALPGLPSIIPCAVVPKG